MSEEQDSRYNTIGDPFSFFLFDWLAVGGLFEALEKSFLPSQSILPKQSNDNDASRTNGCTLLLGGNISDGSSGTGVAVALQTLDTAYLHLRKVIICR